MQVRSPLLQTGFTKGHRPTGLFSFMLFQCEPQSVKACSLLDRLEQTDAGQFSPHRSSIYLPMLPWMDMVPYSPFASEPKSETESLPCKIALGLSVSCSAWTRFSGHPVKVWFKAKLKSGTRYCEFSLPAIWTYYRYGYIHLKIHVHIYVTTHGISLHPVNTFFLKCVWGWDLWKGIQFSNDCAQLFRYTNCK